MNDQTILIAGGYGVVGREIALILRRRHDGVRLLLGGRSPEKGVSLADELGNAESVRFNLSEGDPLSSIGETVDIVLAATNDVDNRLLTSVIERQVAYIDITRWTARLREALAHSATLDTSHAPVIFSSSWMASLISTMAKGLASEYQSIDQIDIDILYSTKDKSGPNAVEYMDRMHIPFEITKGGRKALAKPFAKARKVSFPGQPIRKLYQFDTPDQFSLPLITKARTVEARIGFDDASSGPLLSLLVRSGIWGLFSHERWKKLRHSLLHNPGDGGPHLVKISIKGKDRKSSSTGKSWLISDTKGQTHMTAVGAVVQVERVLAGQANPGIQIAEATTNADLALELSEAEGIKITFI